MEDLIARFEKKEQVNFKRFISRGRASSHVEAAVDVACSAISSRSDAKSLNAFSDHSYRTANQSAHHSMPLRPLHVRRDSINSCELDINNGGTCSRKLSLSGLLPEPEVGTLLFDVRAGNTKREDSTRGEVISLRKDSENPEKSNAQSSAKYSSRAVVLSRSESPSRIEIGNYRKQGILCENADINTKETKATFSDTLALEMPRFKGSIVSSLISSRVEYRESKITTSATSTVSGTGSPAGLIQNADFKFQQPKPSYDTSDEKLRAFKGIEKSILFHTPGVARKHIPSGVKEATIGGSERSTFCVPIPNSNVSNHSEAEKESSLLVGAAKVEKDRERAWLASERRSGESILSVHAHADSSLEVKSEPEKVVSACHVENSHNYSGDPLEIDRLSGYVCSCFDDNLRQADDGNISLEEEKSDSMNGIALAPCAAERGGLASSRLDGCGKLGGDSLISEEKASENALLTRMINCTNEKDSKSINQENAINQDVFITDKRADSFMDAPGSSPDSLIDAVGSSLVKTSGEKPVLAVNHAKPTSYSSCLYQIASQNKKQVSYCAYVSPKTDLKQTSERTSFTSSSSPGEKSETNDFPRELAALESYPTNAPEFSVDLHQEGDCLVHNLVPTCQPSCNQKLSQVSPSSSFATSVEMDAFEREGTHSLQATELFAVSNSECRSDVNATDIAEGLTYAKAAGVGSDSFDPDVSTCSSANTSDKSGLSCSALNSNATTCAPQPETDSETSECSGNVIQLNSNRESAIASCVRGDTGTEVLGSLNNRITHVPLSERNKYLDVDKASGSNFPDMQVTASTNTLPGVSAREQAMLLEEFASSKEAKSSFQCSSEQSKFAVAEHGPVAATQELESLPKMPKRERKQIAYTRTPSVDPLSVSGKFTANPKVHQKDLNVDDIIAKLVTGSVGPRNAKALRVKELASNTTAGSSVSSSAVSIELTQTLRDVGRNRDHAEFIPVDVSSKLNSNHDIDNSAQRLSLYDHDRTRSTNVAVGYQNHFPDIVQSLRSSARPTKSSTNDLDISPDAVYKLRDVPPSHIDDECGRESPVSSPLNPHHKDMSRFVMEPSRVCSEILSKYDARENLASELGTVTNVPAQGHVLFLEGLNSDLAHMTDNNNAAQVASVSVDSIRKNSRQELLSEDKTIRKFEQSVEVEVTSLGSELEANSIIRRAQQLRARLSSATEVSSEDDRARAVRKMDQAVSIPLSVGTSNASEYSPIVSRPSQGRTSDRLAVNELAENLSGGLPLARYSERYVDKPESGASDNSGSKSKSDHLIGNDERKSQRRLRSACVTGESEHDNLVAIDAALKIVQTPSEDDVIDGQTVNSTLGKSGGQRDRAKGELRCLDESLKLGANSNQNFLQDTKSEDKVFSTSGKGSQPNSNVKESIDASTCRSSPNKIGREENFSVKVDSNKVESPFPKLTRQKSLCRQRSISSRVADVLSSSDEEEGGTRKFRRRDSGRLSFKRTPRSISLSQNLATDVAVEADVEPTDTESAHDSLWSRSLPKDASTNSVSNTDDEARSRNKDKRRSREIEVVAKEINPLHDTMMEESRFARVLGQPKHRAGGKNVTEERMSMKLAEKSKSNSINSASDSQASSLQPVSGRTITNNAGGSASDLQSVEITSAENLSSKLLHVPKEAPNSTGFVNPSATLNKDLHSFSDQAKPWCMNGDLGTKLVVGVSKGADNRLDEAVLATNEAVLATNEAVLATNEAVLAINETVLETNELDSSENILSLEVPKQPAKKLYITSADLMSIASAKDSNVEEKKIRTEKFNVVSQSSAQSFGQTSKACKVSEDKAFRDLQKDARCDNKENSGDKKSGADGPAMQLDSKDSLNSQLDESSGPGMQFETNDPTSEGLVPACERNTAASRSGSATSKKALKPKRQRSFSDSSLDPKDCKPLEEAGAGAFVMPHLRSTSSLTVADPSHRGISGGSKSTSSEFLNINWPKLRKTSQSPVEKPSHGYETGEFSEVLKKARNRAEAYDTETDVDDIIADENMAGLEEVYDLACSLLDEFDVSSSTKGKQTEKSVSEAVQTKVEIRDSPINRSIAVSQPTNQEQKVGAGVDGIAVPNTSSLPSNPLKAILQDVPKIVLQLSDDEDQPRFRRRQKRNVPELDDDDDYFKRLQEKKSQAPDLAVAEDVKEEEVTKESSCGAEASRVFLNRRKRTPTPDTDEEFDFNRFVPVSKSEVHEAVVSTETAGVCKVDLGPAIEYKVPQVQLRTNSLSAENSVDSESSTISEVSSEASEKDLSSVDHDYVIAKQTRPGEDQLLLSTIGRLKSVPKTYEMSKFGTIADSEDSARNLLRPVDNRECTRPLAELFERDQNRRYERKKSDTSNHAFGISPEMLLESKAMLKMNGVLTNDQISAVEAGETPKGASIMRQSAVKATEPTHRPITELDEETDLDVVLLMKSLKNDADELYYLCINNQPKLEKHILQEIFVRIGLSQKIRHVSLALTGITDDDVKVLAKHLRHNETIETFNLESNLITVKGIDVLMKVIGRHPAMREVKVSNQKHALGGQGEEYMARAIENNPNILKFGYSFTNPGARNKADRAILKHNEELRQRKKNGENVYDLKEECKKRDAAKLPWIIYKQRRQMASLLEQEVKKMGNMIGAEEATAKGAPAPRLRDMEAKPLDINALLAERKQKLSGKTVEQLENAQNQKTKQQLKDMQDGVAKPQIPVGGGGGGGGFRDMLKKELVAKSEDIAKRQAARLKDEDETNSTDERGSNRMVGRTQGSAATGSKLASGLKAAQVEDSVQVPARSRRRRVVVEDEVEAAEVGGVLAENETPSSTKQPDRESQPNNATDSATVINQREVKACEDSSEAPSRRRNRMLEAESVKKADDAASSQPPPRPKGSEILKEKIEDKSSSLAPDKTEREERSQRKSKMQRDKREEQEDDVSTTSSREKALPTDASTKSHVQSSPDAMLSVRRRNRKLAEDDEVTPSVDKPAKESTASKADAESLTQNERDVALKNKGEEPVRCGNNTSVAELSAQSPSRALRSPKNVEASSGLSKIADRASSDPNAVGTESRLRRSKLDTLSDDAQKDAKEASKEDAEKNDVDNTPSRLSTTRTDASHGALSSDQVADRLREGRSERVSVRSRLNKATSEVPLENKKEAKVSLTTRTDKADKGSDKTPVVQSKVESVSNESSPKESKSKDEDQGGSDSKDSVSEARNSDKKFYRVERDKDVKDNVRTRVESSNIEVSNETFARKAPEPVVSDKGIADKGDWRSRLSKTQAASASEVAGKENKEAKEVRKDLKSFNDIESGTGLKGKQETSDVKKTREPSAREPSLPQAAKHEQSDSLKSRVGDTSKSSTEAAYKSSLVDGAKAKTDVIDLKSSSSSPFVEQPKEKEKSENSKITDRPAKVTLPTVDDAASSRRRRRLDAQEQESAPAVVVGPSRLNGHVDSGDASLFTPSVGSRIRSRLRRDDEPEAASKVETAVKSQSVNLPSTDNRPEKSESSIVVDIFADRQQDDGAPKLSLRERRARLGP